MKKDHGSRRTFLKSVLAGSAVAAGAVTVMTSGRDTGSTAVAGNGPAAGKGGYEEILHRNTEEFRRYYETLKA